MKKLLALLLVLVMLLSFVSCSQTSENENETKPDQTAETEELGLGFSVPRGKIEDGKYTSAYSGLTIALPSDNWSFSSDNDLATEMNVDPELLSSDLSSAIDQVFTVTDMQASDTSTGNTIKIFYSNKGTTPEEHLASVKRSLSSLSGVEYEIAEEGSSTLCGKEYKKIAIEMEAAGTNITRFVFARTTDDSLLVVVDLSYYDQVEIAEAEALFQ